MKPKFTFKSLSNVIILIALLGTSLYLYKKYRVPPKMHFDNLVLLDLKGNKLSLNKDFADQAVFINFFGTWCGTCRSEMDDLEKMAANFQPKNIAVVLLSDEPTATLNAFQQAHSYQLSLYSTPIALKDLNIHTYPTSYLLNKKHQLVYSKVNPEKWSDEKVMNQLIKLAE